MLFASLRILVVLGVLVAFAGSLLAILVTGPVSPRPPRVEVATQASAERLRQTVEMLSVDLAPLDYRHVENLDRAAAWIEAAFQATGMTVEIQDYETDEGRFRNVIAVRTGREPGAGAIVVGAHYDTYGGFPGANDNASGVAVLLELARTISGPAPRGPQYFAAFSTEEPPFFASDAMGSFVFARELEQRGTRVDLMVALDLVGYYSDAPRSQRFPAPGLGLLYPDTGNFVGVVGDLRSGASLKRVRTAMDATRRLPVYSFRAPASLPGVNWSDHLSFRRLGMPGVLVTDTAFMRDPHYHTREDTADRLDYERMALLVESLHGVVGGS